MAGDIHRCAHLAKDVATVMIEERDRFCANGHCAFEFDETRDPRMLQKIIIKHYSIEMMKRKVPWCAIRYAIKSFLYLNNIINCIPNNYFPKSCFYAQRVYASLASVCCIIIYTYICVCMCDTRCYRVCVAFQINE